MIKLAHGAPVAGGISQAKWRCSMTAAGDSADGKMDRRTAADGNGRICESLVISTSEGRQTHHKNIKSRPPYGRTVFRAVLLLVAIKLRILSQAIVTL